MWAPVDVSAVPTVKELVEAKLAIEKVESELENALLEPANLRVANLTKDLKERRAWIAPIRRLSFDVLSLIFEWCGEADWRTPLRISGVSRLWRDLVLATPRAWAFLLVYECKDERDLIRHFFQHSGQRPLHVLRSKDQHFTILSEVSERLECLSVNEFFQLEEILVFPRLKRLSVRSVDEHIELSDLCITRFPALQELICEPTITTVAAFLPSSIKANFPPLQVLSIATEGNPTWLELLMGCQSTLVSLTLHIINEDPNSRRQVQVHLPMLRGLEIHLWDYAPHACPVIMGTPALETYIEWREQYTSLDASLVHKDVGTVTQVRVGQKPAVKQTRVVHQSILSAMNLLHIIQLGTGVDIVDFLSQLQSSQSLCPRLEVVEVMQEGDLGPYQTSLVKVNRERSQPISIRKVKAWAAALPYEISQFSVSN